MWRISPTNSAEPVNGPDGFIIASRNGFRKEALMSYDFGNPIDQQKPAVAPAVSIVFGGILVGLSGLTSAAFFYAYAGTAFAFIAGNLSAWLAAVVGVLCFEGASLTWAWLRANDAGTASQISTSNIAAWATMAGGLIVTVIYFALNTPLINAQLDATGEMVFSLIGGVLIIAGIAGNFAAAHIYRINAPTHVAASNQAEIRAMSASAQHMAARESTFAEMARTLEQIREQLPQTTTMQGEANAGQFLRERFGIARNGDRVPTRPTQASPNGQRENG